MFVRLELLSEVMTLTLKNNPFKVRIDDIKHF